MDQPETTVVSVERARLKENRETTDRKAVIRVQQGKETSYANGVNILGPSRLVYRPDTADGGGPEVWLETDAEVKLEQTPAAADAPVRGASSPPERPKPLLSRLQRTALLDMATLKLEEEARSGAIRPDRLKRLGDLLRQRGDLPAAARTYEAVEALAPGDPAVQRLIALLRGNASPAMPVIWPEPFVLVSNFLSEVRVEEMREFASSHRDLFAITPVLQQGRNVIDRRERWCTSMFDTESLDSWFVPEVQSALSDHLAQLELPAQSFVVRDCKMVHYGDGGFFGPHVDRGPGAETRVLGFVYYFYFPPRRFRGGGVAIYDRNVRTGRPANSGTTIIPEQNQLLLLTSDCWHEVLPVECPPDEWDAGRFAFSGWICREG